MALLARFIGIDRYQDPGIRDLTGAARDARALWALFSDTLPDDLNGKLLTDSDATLAAVRSALEETLGAATEEDVVLLSFAGHGTNDHRLVVGDSRIDALPDTTLDMGDLAAWFRESKARAVVLLLDCCFSGGAPARVLEGTPASRQPGIPLAEIGGRGRILFAASGIDEPALEDPSSRHGLFTQALIEGLSAGDQPVSMVSLVDTVVRSVRANAARFGYVQTPVIFGHIEGELSLPALHRGTHFADAFPDQAIIPVTKEFSSLSPYEIDPAILGAWAERYPTGLNDLQLSAINDHGVLNGQSLLVVAPTSAGKTFIGEVAAMKTVGDGRKSVFLLPYKALVNEKYLDFYELYGPTGLRVIRCSGDWQDQVGAFLRGKYDLAFLTYEKFLGLMLASPYILNQIGLVVLDEAQFITEAGRGMAVELLLTALVSARVRGVAPQIIALSAVIGHTNAFEEWLGSRLLVMSSRPVPLTEGVIDRTGVRIYRSAGGEDLEDEFLPRMTIRQRRDKPSSQDLIVPLVRKLVNAGEKVIVFRNARGPAGGAAEYLAAELGLPAATEVLENLPTQDLSTTSERLRRSLQGGVAFHNSDLSREERAIVEAGFRRVDGGIQVLVATTTVAAGVNTPASTVIIVETEFYGGTDGSTPFTVAQYKNMAGRAGRLGFETEGKSILIADTGTDRRKLFQTYVDGQPEPIRSSFDPDRPATWVVRLLAQVRGVERDQVLDLVANTYGGFLVARADQSWRERIRPRVFDLLNRMITDELIEERDSKLHLTILGRACAESPLAFESAMQLVEMLRTFDGSTVSAEALMALVQGLPEQDADYTPMARGRGEAVWPSKVSRGLGQAVSRALQRRAESDTLYYARCKRALILSDWINGISVQQIESQYSLNAFARVGAGDIRGFADGTRFLLESALRIAAILRDAGADNEADDMFLKRLELGLPEEVLPLTDLPVALTRGDYLALFREGLASIEAVLASPKEVLVQIVGATAADSIGAL